MKWHIVALYFLSLSAIAISLVSISFSPTQQPDNSGLTMKVKKVEFYQEASRVSNNLIGFNQVFNSLANDKERLKQCQDSADLLKEWQGDVTALGNLNQDYVNADSNAQSLKLSAEKLYQQISTDCTKLINEK